MILQNYEKIVKTIASSIRDGNLTSRNSDKLQGYSVAQLYSMFVNKFNFHIQTETHMGGVNPFTNTYDIMLDSPALAIIGIYFEGVGSTIEVELNGPTQTIKLPLEKLNVDVDLLGQCKIDYMMYTNSIDEVIDVIALGLE